MKMSLGICTRRKFDTKPEFKNWRRDIENSEPVKFVKSNTENTEEKRVIILPLQSIRFVPLLICDCFCNIRWVGITLQIRLPIMENGIREPKKLFPTYVAPIKTLEPPGVC
uniref:Uncharacterized protein n=1 Tax=Lygus hesperus TaxID=30085 RepID=A0A0A9YUB9_LYGHE